jgi:predicted RNase H-like HicB family nuclease
MFEVTEDVDGGYVAECLTETIVTQGDTWEELRANVKDAVEGFYFDGEKPSVVRMRLVKDEVLMAG